MPKRTFWLVTGAAIGAGSSLWAERQVRRTVQQAAARLQPDALVVGVGRSARQAADSAGFRMRDAVASGRDEMQRREEELWADLAGQGVTAEPAPPPRSPSLRPAADVDEHRPSHPTPRLRLRKRSPVKSPSHLAK